MTLHYVEQFTRQDILKRNIMEMVLPSCGWGWLNKGMCSKMA